MAALALGAEGIEMGTRLIAVEECVDACELYKNALVSGTENDTVVIKRFSIQGAHYDVPSTAELFDPIISQAEAIRKKWAE